MHMVTLGDEGWLCGEDGSYAYSCPEGSGPNKPYKKPGLTYRPGQAEEVGLDW
jgi:hypothetical protein